MADRVAVRDQYGEIGTIDASRLVPGSGYTPLSEEEIAHEKAKQERGSLGQQGIAAVEGAGRGLSAGLSDVALSKALGADYAKAARERKEFNPLTAGASEIAGAVAPALFTGGASAEAGLAARGLGAARAAEEAGALSKVARFIPSNLIGEAGTFAERAAARVTGEGAEGALARMAQRAAGLGARGAAEGGLYGAGMAASDAALNDAPITAEKLLSGFGHGALYGGIGGAGLGALGSLGSSAIERLAGSGGVRGAAERVANRSALEAIGATSSDLERIAAKSGRTADQVVAEAGPELLNYRFESGPLAGKKLFSGAKRAEDFVDDLGLARQETAQRVELAQRAAEEAGVAPNVSDYLARVDRELAAPLRQSNSPTIRKQAEALAKELSLLEQRASGTAVDPLIGAPLPPPGIGELQRFSADLKSAFPERTAQHEAAKLLDQEIDAAVERHMQASGLDPAGYAQAKKTLGALADMEQVARDAASKADKPTDATGLAMTLGAMLTGNVGGLALGKASDFARKLIRDRGQSVLAVMADNVAKMDGRIEGAAQALAGVPRKALTVATSHEPDLDRFDSTAETVRGFAQNPEIAAAKLAKPVEAIAPLHPELAAKMQETLTGDYQYLATQLPPSLTRADNSLTPQVEIPVVPKSQKRKFMQIVQALENPSVVIEKVAKGDLPQAQIDALKVRRPEIYQQMRTEVIKAFSTAKKPASFLERTRVSLAFDFNGDASLDPQTLRAIQSSNRNAAPEPDQPATAQGTNQPRPAPSNLDPKQAEAMVLPSDKAQGA